MTKHYSKSFILSCSMVAGIATAAPQGVPPGLDDLPPGRLKSKIDTLPLAAQQRAMDWLERFSIPQQDFEQIDVDPDGGIFYVDVQHGHDHDHAHGAESTTEGPFVAGAVTAAEAFALNSNPGAAKTIYLDFDGHTFSGTAWNSSVSSYAAKPYDRDGSPYTFSDSELADIANIWHRVAEDYAAFDVNVTTELPASFGPQAGRVLITASTDEYGNAMPASNAGGVAYVGVWGRSNYTYYQPALVYFDNLGGGAPRYVAEAASHEMGHNQGLSHDGTSTTSYYGGHGSGNTDWAPIMGGSYNGQVTQWSRGEYADANNNQDDIAILANNLTLRVDDHGNTVNSASVLVMDTAGHVTSTNPEMDPANHQPENKGIISTSSDVDVFYLEAGAGEIQLTATPAWAAYTDGARGANLDIRLALLDSMGNEVAVANPTTDTDAQLTYSTAGGVYYVAVTGVSDTPSASTYSDYASHGFYYLNGFVPVASSSNNNVPVASNDTATVLEDGSVSIQVLANDTDMDGDVLSINMVSNGTLGQTSTNGTSITYIPDANANGVDTFEYSIMDGQGGSATAQVTVNITPVNDAPIGFNDSASTQQDTAVSINVVANDYDADGDTLTVTGANGALNGSLTFTGSHVTFTPIAGFFGEDSFSYTFTDNNGGTGSAEVTVTVTETVAQPEVPASFQALNNSNGTVTLSWTDTTSETGYEIQRETKHKKRNSYNGTAIIAMPGANITSHVDTSGTGDFRYRIRSANQNGASAWSNWIYVSATDTSGGSGSGGKGPNKGRSK